MRTLVHSGPLDFKYRQVDWQIQSKDTLAAVGFDATRHW